MGDTYGEHGEFRRIPREIQLEARKAAIARFVRHNPKKAMDLLKRGKIKPEDVKVVINAL